MRAVTWCFLGMLQLMFSQGSVFAGSPSGELQKQIYEARNRVLPALVHVEPIKTIYTTGEKQHTLVTGSGVIFSAEGYIITNHHVTESAEKVWCTLSNKQRITARVVGSDASTDIAVLKLNLEELTDPSLPYARLGNSDSVEVGQIVLALGSPLGLSRSVSMGVISSIDRYFPRSSHTNSPYNLWIQTDAAINPGNSGGPLINLEGEVIGINARAVFLAENLGFAIPINLAKEVARQIIHGAGVKRSWIGVTLMALKDFKEYLGLNDLSGVLITQVRENSPAAKAGLEPGDIIQKINGSTLHAEYKENLPAIHKIIADLPIDRSIPFTIWRKGKIKTVTIHTAAEPLIEYPEFEALSWGMVVKNLNWSILRVQMLPDFFGVHITAVKSGGLADKANIHNGDVIRKINGTLVKNMKDFRRLYQRYNEQDAPYIFMELIRSGHPYFTVIKTESTH